jgi:hypothetical protein
MGIATPHARITPRKDASSPSPSFTTLYPLKRRFISLTLLYHIFLIVISPPSSQEFTAILSRDLIHAHEEFVLAVDVDGVLLPQDNEVFLQQVKNFIENELDLLGTELSLSLRGRMTLGVATIFGFISHTLSQCHALQGVGDTYL